MLTIRLICHICGHVTYTTPTITKEPMEDIGCPNCNANLCVLIRSDDE